MGIETILKQAVRCHQEGRLEAANDLYGKLLKTDPNHPDALHLSGLVAHQSGKNQLAAHLITRAIEMDPNQAIFHCNLGNVMMSGGDFKGAAVSFQKAVDLNPELVEAQYNLGNAFYEESRLDQAISCFQETVNLRPDFAEAHNNMGIALYKKGRLSEAIACFQNTLRQNPGFPDSYKNLGDLLEEQNKPDQAIQQYEKAIELRPDYIEAYFNMGNVFHAQGKLDKAARCYQKALQINPEHIDAYANLGKTFKDQGELEKALSCYDKGISLKPEHAELLFDRSTVLLLMGDFYEGWQGYERRFDRPSWKTTYPHHLDIPRWDGSPFIGKTLFIHCEQGFGDILQFARYLPMVKARGGKVVFETLKPLMKLFEGFPGVDALVEGLSNGDQAEGCDFYMPLMSLPGLFGTSLKTIPARTPYIHAELKKIEYWNERFVKKGLRVGLVWEGKDTDPNRSCPIERFTALAEVQGVQWFGLQKGKAAAQAEELHRGMRLFNIGEEFDDFSDTAGAIENMDLIISIDTAVAHLTGAMGKPVWVLLKFSPDWRWLMKREDSPWYPTMRLFRQPKSGDWGAVIKRVAEELKMLVNIQSGAVK